MQAEKNKKYRIIYLHGRPSAHPLHASLASSVTDNFDYIDRPIRWQDRKAPQFLNFLACVINAFLFPHKKKYDFFLIDNLHFTPVFLKKLGLISTSQKIVVHLGSHTLFFMASGRFSRITNFLHKWALNQYDAVICEGNYSFNVAKSLIHNPDVLVYESFIGIPQARQTQLNNIQFNVASKNILIIAGGPNEFRKHYKGLDLMINGFFIASEKHPELKLHIIGDWSDSVIEPIMNKYSTEQKTLVTFHGKQPHVEHFFDATGLCIHCTRGDAFPTSTMETMSAGIPTIVSDITGTKQIVSHVSGKFVVKPDSTEIANAILWYFNLEESEKLKLSTLSKNCAAPYTGENALVRYKEIFTQITGVFQNVRK